MALRESRNGLVILAHTPPPLHGQSMMVALLIDALKETPDYSGSFAFYHINCRYSDDLESMGRPAVHKFFLALGYAFRALFVRFRHKAVSLYYIPAPGKRPAFLRDCLVLFLLRPFFRRVIFHWHAAGLSHWLQKHASGSERWLGRIILGGNSLSIVLVDEKIEEVSYFHPGKIEVIPNGIPDPCPSFVPRSSRIGNSLSSPIRLLFLSTATKEKGVFAAVSTWQHLNERASKRGGPFYQLSIAGEFPDTSEKEAFYQFLLDARSTVYEKNPGIEEDGCKVEILGAVQGERKAAAYSEADIFLFPSTCTWESFGLVLVEAAHFGLPCVTYQPLVGPNGLSPIYHHRVPLGDLDAFVLAVENVSLDHGREIRVDALQKFNIALFGERMRAACQADGDQTL